MFYRLTRPTEQRFQNQLVLVRRLFLFSRQVLGARPFRAEHFMVIQVINRLAVQLCADER